MLTELDDDFVRAVSHNGDPASKVALFFPVYGRWRHRDYFTLDTNRFVQLHEGRLEVHKPPALHHHIVLDQFLAESSISSNGSLITPCSPAFD